MKPTSTVHEELQSHNQWLCADQNRVTLSITESVRKCPLEMSAHLQRTHGSKGWPQWKYKNIFNQTQMKTHHITIYKA
jgi:hypothetical protein